MKLFSTYPLRISLIVLALSAAAYLIFEQSTQLTPDSEEEIQRLMDEALDQGEDLFYQTYREFKESSNRLFDEVTEFPVNRQNLSHIHNTFEEFGFWGSALYQRNNRLVWNGFSISPVPVAISGSLDSLRVSVLKRNNVVYLMGQRSFQSEEEPYHLLTSQMLELTSNLPFADRTTFRLSDDPSLRSIFPVTFNFFDALPDEPFEYRTLSTESADSVGIVWATPDDFSVYAGMEEADQAEWRVFFHITIFLALFIFLVTWSAYNRSLAAYVLQFGILTAGWYLLFPAGLLDGWIESILRRIETPADHQTVSVLVRYLFQGVMLMLLAIFSFNYFRAREVKTGREFSFSTLLLSMLFGLLSLFFILLFILATESILIQTNLPLLDLELAPDISSFFFYIACGIYFIATAGIILSAGAHLFKIEQDKAAIITVSSLFSFFLFYYLADLLLDVYSLFTWVSLLAGGLFFVYLLILQWIHKFPDSFREMSGFRRMMLGVILASVAGYIVVWNTSNERIDRELRERAEDFASEEIADTRSILTAMLFSLESNLSFLSEEDVQNRAATVQAQFQRAINASIQPEWRKHSFEVQLLDPRGEPISDFSTNLDTPGWRSLVNIRIMQTSYTEEQLRRETNRPIVWDRPTDLGENFISFNRGWIPIWSQDVPYRIIAWIFAAAYQERPDYNKPIRAVLADAGSSDWKQSFYLAEFAGDRVTRTALQGIYSNQPEYNRLPTRETEIVTRDSLAFITNITAQGSFREILLKKEENRFIKASTPVPGFNHHLFSFFRFHIVLVFFGLFLFATLAIFGLNYFSLFGQSRKFRHRLLDGLTLSTILFLTILIFATQYAVSNQNEKNVERELITKLNSLSESLRGEVDLTPGRAASGSLAEFANPLNVDAILYAGPNVLDSTTPQIFQQHLMPRSMPFPAYDFLYNRERRHYITTERIGDETLLVGYRALLDENNAPAGAIAIPTFVQSPVYREQLLETTSYLFGVYLAIFALFIIGTVFFSSRLTKPLQIVQSGLNKISRGDMKTQVNVTSNDEIGSLARAYNQMVDRLDHAQRELVKAEREAAWKEMAQQVAHEIKNPLTPMKLNLQHLQRQLEANPENVMELKPAIERTASNIIDQIESLNKIASDFSKFARPVHEPMQEVNLNKLLSSVCDLYQYDEDVEIECSLPSADLITSGVDDELRRVLINLVKNGIESYNQPPAKIRVSMKRNGEMAVITISDQGSGIETDARDRIFVPNFSTKSSGTGLGLAITKKIIEAHHGEISFDSNEGEGTTFIIRLPLGGHVR